MLLRNLLRVLGAAALMGGAVVASLVLMEFVIRWVPALLPAGGYGHGAFSKDLRMGVHGGPLIYNKVRYVQRMPNGEGFLDVEHPIRKSPGTVRIGFFGDSYVEASQVEIRQTFFRLLAESARQLPMEILAFGVSGWGTLHASIAEAVLGPRYDIDLVVYVFVENDLGDSFYDVGSRSAASSLRPLGRLSDEEPGYSVQAVPDPASAALPLRIAKQIQSRSLLAQVVWSRIALLMAHGVNARAKEPSAGMDGVSSVIPQATDLPATWPERYRRDAQELGRRILTKWARDVRGRGKEFWVFYVPRGNSQLSGEIPLASTWRPWLGEVTEELGIPLIDPTEDLANLARSGVKPYDDHFSPEGHTVVARHLAKALLAKVPSLAARVHPAGAVSEGPPAAP